MMLDDLREYFDLLDRVSDTTRKLPQIAATLAVNFSKDRFTAGNWLDNSTEVWPKRKPMAWGKKQRKGRALLVDSGRLRRSIRKIYVDEQKAIIGTDVPYAEVHNNGFRGKVTQKVRSHKRNLTKFGVIIQKNNKRSTRIAFGRVVRGSTTVKTYTRVIRLNIPRRRFIGPSAVLDAQIQRMMTAELMKSMKG